MGLYKKFSDLLVISTKVLEGSQQEFHKDFTRIPFGILQNFIRILHEFYKDFCDDSARILKGFDREL